MNQEHVISDEVLDQALLELSRGNYWIAYNSIPYLLEKGDVYFFKEKSEAGEFAVNNISEFDNYKTIYVRSLTELLKQIPYGENLSKQMSNPDANGLYNSEGNAFTDALILHLEQQSILNNKNLSIMNEKNYDYLVNQLKYTGFGEDLQEKLKDKINLQEPQFSLGFQKDYGTDQAAATLHFKKSEESDMYFFNSYTLLLKNEKYPDAVKQTFYMSNKDDNITLKEAYNLMSGRAVHKELSNKEGEKYKAWLQVDFKEMDTHGNYKMKQFHENYKYDLQSTLGNHPIKELQNDTDRQRLMESLERGNRQSVTLDINGKDQKVFIEAVPQFKSLNFYEASGQRIRTDKLYESTAPEKTVVKEKKQGIKKSNGKDEDAPDTGKMKTRKKRQSIT